MTAAVAPPTWTAGMQPAAAGLTRFACDLYARVRDGAGSRFVSPLSVHAAFALLAEGAVGPTRDELAAALHLPPDSGSVGDLCRYYAAGGRPYELSVANSLWGQAGYPWRPEFVARARDRFGAALTPADFFRDPEAGRAAVNKWVEGQTRDRIKNLLPAGAVTPLTRLVLANAVYFKGDWAAPFPKGATTDQPFTRADGTTAPVPLMARTGRYALAAADGLQVLELPYAGGELAMLVVLPDTPGGLTAVEAKLSAEVLAGWLTAATPQRVRVFLPRFQVEHVVKLPPVMQALGVRRAFDRDGADLSGLVTHLPEDRLYVTEAVHKAFVEVTETGTEAAAATGVVVGTRSVSVEPMPAVFRADRPFLFLIRDVAHGTVLFVGRYAGP